MISNSTERETYSYILEKCRELSDEYLDLIFEHEEAQILQKSLVRFEEILFSEMYRFDLSMISENKKV